MLPTIDILQTFSEVFPPAPTFTEADVPDLSGRVYLVTGGASGIGFELCKILYSKNATIHLAGRHAPSATTAITTITTTYPASTGTLHYLPLDLSSLATIKPAAQQLLAATARLDVIWHNAGVMLPPLHSVDAHGRELQLGTNVVGPWLLQWFLTPLMQATAERGRGEGREDGGVRVVWVSSVSQIAAPWPGGVDWRGIEEGDGGVLGGWIPLWVPGGPLLARVRAYSQSKAMNVLLAAEAARRWKGSGIVSLSVNPGNLKSNLDRTTPAWIRFLLDGFFYYPPRHGALTELWAGLAPGVTEEQHGGAFVLPWGRWGRARADIEDAVQGVEGMEGQEGGGGAERLWQWCWGVCREFM